MTAEFSEATDSVLSEPLPRPSDVFAMVEPYNSPVRQYELIWRGADVVRHLPAKTKPEQVWVFLMTAHPELEGMSPLEWIYAGRTIQALIRLAKVAE